MFPSNVDFYPRKEIYARVDQIVGPNNTYGDVFEAECRALAESIYTYKYKYLLGIMILYDSHVFTPDDATYTEDIKNIDGKKLLIDRYSTVMLDAVHLRCSVGV